MKTIKDFANQVSIERGKPIPSPDVFDPDRYTFESDGHGRMGKTWASRKEVIRAIAEWLEVCAINDFFPSVKIILLEQSPED